MALEAPIAPTKEILLSRWDEIVSHVPDLFKDNPQRIETDAFGNILMSPPPGYHIQKCAFRIATLLEQRLPGDGTVLEQYVLTDEGVRMPDVIWISPGRIEVWPNQPMSPAPDICVEVRSPSNTAKELELKRDAYFRAGAREVWFCDMNNRMTFFGPDGEMEKSRICPSFPSVIQPYKT